MNDNQIAFLEELSALFDKYNIDPVYIGHEVKPDGRIVFSSNNEKLFIKGYDDGVFHGLGTESKNMTFRSKDKNKEG